MSNLIDRARHELNLHDEYRLTLDQALCGYDNPVLRSTHEEVREVRYGKKVLSVLHLADGASYKVIRGYPHEADQRTDSIVSSSSAWFTRPHQGMNERFSDYYLHQGVPHVMVGPVLHWSHRPSLYRSGNNQHEITDYYAATLGITHNRRVLSGVSRGAMNALVMAAQAGQAGQLTHEIEYLDVTAPCFPDEGNMDYVRTNAPKILSELGIIASLISLSPMEIWRYRQTVDHSLRGIAYALETIPELTSGKMRHIVEHIPDDTRGRVHVFEQDILSHTQTWRELFAPFPDMRFTSSLGGHMMILHNNSFEKSTESVMRSLGLEERE